jgi:hypothetical protein
MIGRNCGRVFWNQANRCVGCCIEALPPTIREQPHRAIKAANAMNFYASYVRFTYYVEIDPGLVLREVKYKER